MKAVLLIFAFAFGPANGGADVEVHREEFKTLAECVAAKKLVEEVSGTVSASAISRLSLRDVRAVCVEKS